MKLRSLRLNQFRKFTSPMALMGMRDGLNVLVGSNEFGKSTLVHALHAVMFERHGSAAAAIKALSNTASEAAPVVEASFEIAGNSYLVRKRFLRKPYAKLEMPGGVVLEGERAEDTLRELLSFARPGNQGAKPDDLGVWSVLWISQGAALGSVEVPELAKTTLRSALENSVGQILGGEQSQRLPAVIAGALGEQMTSTGKPRGPYKAALDSVAELELAMQGLSQRRAELQSDLDACQEARDALARLQDEEHENTLQAELDAAQARLSEHSALRLKIAAAKAELARQQDRAQQAKDSLAQRLQLESSVEKAGQRVLQIADALAVADAERARLKQAAGAAREAQAAAASARQKAHKARQLAAQTQRGAQVAVSLDALQQRLKQAEQLAVAQREQASLLERNKLTAERMQEIDAAAIELQTSAARLSAAAPRISFRIDESAKDAVNVAGKALAEGHSSILALDEVLIEIQGIGAIEISPSIRDGDFLQAAFSDAKQALQEALSTAGVSSLEEAREQARQRATLLAEARETQLRLDALGAAKSGGLLALREETQQAVRALTALEAELDIRSFPDLEHSQRTLSDAERQAADAEIALQSARDLVDSTASSLRKHEEDRDQGRDEAVLENAELERLRKALQHADAPDSLQARVRETALQVSQQSAVLGDLEKLAAVDTPEAVAARVQRLQESLQARAQKKGDLEKEQARLQGAIANAQGGGLDEKLADAGRALDFAQQEVERHTRDAAVLTLLGETLRAAEQQAHDRFMAPVIAKVQPYLNLVFPGAAIDLDASLQVSGILRPPPGANSADNKNPDAQSFDLLSMGTQEQITVLTRIAFAELMAEQGRPAMLVLDDALAYSDDHRMARLFDVLTLASKNVQILLLTCREQSFAAVGGHRLFLESTGESELQSA